jgi:predicted AAA+ superfamily ATPase
VLYHAAKLGRAHRLRLCLDLSVEVAPIVAEIADVKGVLSESSLPE